MATASTRGASTANVDAATSSTEVFAANPGASARIVVNDSTAVLRLKFGAAAASDSFTVKLGAGDYYEFPKPVYDGVVHGIWEAVDGAARVTEVA